MWSLNLSKENFKFSGAHFTTFSADQAERLHGHNYYVEVSLKGKNSSLNHGMIVDLQVPKEMVKSCCDEMDEKVLIAKNNPFTKIKDSNDNLEVSFSKKLYSFPKDDCFILPSENVTIEELAKYISDKLENSFKDLPLSSYEVRVYETRGQSSSFLREL